MDRHTHRKRDGGRTNRHSNRLRDGRTDRQTECGMGDGRTDRQTNRLRNGKTDRQTECAKKDGRPAGRKDGLLELRAEVGTEVERKSEVLISSVLGSLLVWSSLVLLLQKMMHCIYRRRQRPTATLTDRPTNPWPNKGSCRG